MSILYYMIGAAGGFLAATVDPWFGFVSAAIACIVDYFWRAR